MSLRWEARAFSFERRPSDPGPYTVLTAYLFNSRERKPKHRVELTASPTGRNLHVYVDGVRYEPVEDTE